MKLISLNTWGGVGGLDGLLKFFKKYEGVDIFCLQDGLGSFVELEKLAADDADAAAVGEELFATLESLGLSRTDQETHGYDTQLYKLERGKD